MTETYTAGTNAALSADVYRQELFLKIAFPGYTLLMCTLLRPYTLGVDLYNPIGAVNQPGSLGGVSIIAENADVTAEPVTFTLTGLDATLATELRDFTHQGAPVTLQVGLFDSTGAIIPDPVTIFVGVVDTMSMQLGATLTITVTADSYLRLLFRGPDGHRRMQSDQAQLFPSDLGLEFAAQLADTVPWGVPSTVSPTPSAAATSAGGRFTGPGILGAAGRVIARN